jgi:hypothetical protein
MNTDADALTLTLVKHAEKGYGMRRGDKGETGGAGEVIETGNDGACTKHA